MPVTFKSIVFDLLSLMVWVCGWPQVYRQMWDKTDDQTSHTSLTGASLIL